MFCFFAEDVFNNKVNFFTKYKAIRLLTPEFQRVIYIFLRYFFVRYVVYKYFSQSIASYLNTVFHRVKILNFGEISVYQFLFLNYAF